MIPEERKVLKAENAALHRRRAIERRARDQDAQRRLDFQKMVQEPMARLAAQVSDDPEPAVNVSSAVGVAMIPAEWDDRQHSVVPGKLADRKGGVRQLVVVDGDKRQLPLGLVEADHTEPEPAMLPGIPPVQKSQVPVLPFVSVYDRFGGRSMTQGRGAAIGLRLYVDVLMAIPPVLRSSEHPMVLTCTLRQLVGAVWPRGWQRGRDWPRLMAGLADLSRLGVEWELPNGQGGVRFVVTVRDQPRDGALLDDVCRFEVLLPPGSGRGPMVDRGYIRLLGLDSARLASGCISRCAGCGTRMGRSKAA